MTWPASLGWRLILGSVLCTTAAVALAAILAWIAARSSLSQSVDKALFERCTHMRQRGIFLHAERNEPQPPPPPMESGSYRGRPLFQIMAPDGSESMRSSSLQPEVSLLALVEQEDRIQEVDIGDGRSARALRFTLPVRRGRSGPVEPDSSPKATAVIATDITDLALELRRLAWILVSVGSAAAFLAVVLAFWLRRAVLRPVAHIAAGIVAIAPGDAAARVPTAGVPQELALIVDRLNELLDRLHLTLGREKATLAAIAHELRTPVAGLRTTLEFARRRDDGGRAAQTYATCHGLVLGMQAMIDHLLMLARIEAGQLPVETGPVEAVGIIRSSWEAVAARAAERSLSLAFHLPESAWVGLGPAWLTLLVGNLLDNLVSHAPPASAGSVTLASRAGAWHLTVDNQDPGTAIDPEDAVRPFWRGDPARGVGTHCGLGLALCQRVVRLVQGRMDLSTADGHFRVEVVLPAGHPSATAPPGVADSPGDMPPCV